MGGVTRGSGVHHPNSRGHAKAWESITPTQGATPKLGSPSPQLKGTRSEVAHKWAHWLHHPSRLGGLQHFRARDKFSSDPHGQIGYINPAVSGGPQRFRALESFFVFGVSPVFYLKKSYSLFFPGCIPKKAGRSLRNQIFFFAQDCPEGPHQGTANRQPPPTANHQPPPIAANRQRRPTANRQPLPTTTNHQSPTTNCRQPPPTATNRQLPTASRQLVPTRYRQPPPTMVEHMECPRAFLGKLCNGTFFFH